MFKDVFDCLPFAAVIENAVFATKGQICDQAMSLDYFREIERPSIRRESSLLCDAPELLPSAMSNNTQSTLESFLDRNFLSFAVVPGIAGDPHWDHTGWCAHGHGTIFSLSKKKNDSGSGYSCAFMDLFLTSGKLDYSFRVSKLAVPPTYFK